MILSAYSIYDRKALQYFSPFYASTDAAATRSFADLANDLNTNIGRHPSDFVLFNVGVFDDNTGELLAVTPLKHVADAQALVLPPSALPLFPQAAGNDEPRSPVRPNGEAR